MFASALRVSRHSRSALAAALISISTLAAAEQSGVRLTAEPGTDRRAFGYERVLPLYGTRSDLALGACQRICRDDANCNSYTLVPVTRGAQRFECYISKRKDTPRPLAGAVSGVKIVQTAPSIGQAPVLRAGCARIPLGDRILDFELVVHNNRHNRSVPYGVRFSYWYTDANGRRIPFIGSNGRPTDEPERTNLRSVPAPLDFGVRDKKMYFNNLKFTGRAVLLSGEQYRRNHLAPADGTTAPGGYEEKSRVFPRWVYTHVVVHPVWIELKSYCESCQFAQDDRASDLKVYFRRYSRPATVDLAFQVGLDPASRFNEEAPERGLGSLTDPSEQCNNLACRKRWNVIEPHSQSFGNRVDEDRLFNYIAQQTANASESARRNLRQDLGRRIARALPKPYGSYFVRGDNLVVCQVGASPPPN